jgi:hypothetical protein
MCKTLLPAHTPAAHPKEDHLRFLAKTLLPVFFYRRCRRFHCSAPQRFYSRFSHHPIAPTKTTVPELQSMVASPFRPADLDLTFFFSFTVMKA